MTAKSETPTLNAESRTITGRKVKNLRAEGKLPAVVYGNKQESRALVIDLHTFSKLYDEVGSTTLVNLVIDGKAPIKVLIHDVVVNALTRHADHADFYQVNLKEKLQTEIPLNFVGVADAVEIQGGIFLAVKSEVEIECLPEDLVQELEVDITSLKTFEDSITAADLVMPKGITLLTEPEQVIASVSEPISEEELAALDEAPVADATTEFDTTSGTEAAPAEEEAK